MGSGNCKSCSSMDDYEQNGAGPSNFPIEKQPDQEYVEMVVCKETDINENEAKNFEFNDNMKVMLINQNGKLSALGTKCTHYGALLTTGSLSSSGRIRCPWHGACFNAETGDIEDFPGLDSLPCYKVNVVKGEVLVQIKTKEIGLMKRIKDMVKHNPNNSKTFVVVGGGPSAATCAESIRQSGFTGRLVMVCKEKYLPYDRVQLTKQMDLNIIDKQYRSNDFYNKYDIEVMNETAANKVNTQAKTVHLDNGYNIKYDALYIATGSSPRRLNVPGANLKQVVTLREYDDLALIQSHIDPDAHVVCYGLSFISLESAAYCAGKVEKVTIIGRDTVPLRQSFGPEIGQRIVELFQANNVEFRFGNEIVQFIADEENSEKLAAVELKGEEQLKCDVCIVGLGSTFNTDFLEDSEIQLNEDGSITVNMFLESNVKGVFVGGDIARAPVKGSTAGTKATIGHIGLAQYHGHLAGYNMVADKPKEVITVPYFWTSLFGKSFRYAGFGRPEKVQIEGSLEDLKFVAFFFDSQDNVCAMASCQRDPFVSQYADYIQNFGHLPESELANDPFGWTKKVKVPRE